MLSQRGFAVSVRLCPREQLLIDCCKLSANAGGTGSLQAVGRPSSSRQGSYPAWPGAGRRAEATQKHSPRPRSAARGEKGLSEPVPVSVSKAEVPGQRVGDSGPWCWERLCPSGACVPGDANPRSGGQLVCWLQTRRGRMCSGGWGLNLAGSAGA